MLKRIQFLRGNTAAISSFTGLLGELTVNTDNWSIVVHDGVTVGGHIITGGGGGGGGNVDYSSNIATLESNAAAQQTSIVNLESGVLDLIANAATQSGQLSTLSGNVTTLIANAAVQAGLISSLQNNVVSLLANAGAQSGALASLSANAAAQEDSIANIYANLGTVSGSIATLTANAGLQSNQLSILFANAGAQAGLIASLNAELDANSAVFADQIADIYSNLAVKTGQITDLYANAAGQAGVLSILTANAASQAGELTTLFSNAAVQSGQLATLTSNAASQAGELATLTANASAQAGELTTLTANAAVQAGELSTLTANAAVQAGTLALLTANAASQSGLIAAAEANIVIANTAMKGYVDTVVSMASSYSNVQVAQYLPTYTGNVGGTLTTAAQPNITTVGNLTSLSAAGTIQTTGIVYANSGVTSTGKTTGALVVNGGVGVSGNLIANTINVSNFIDWDLITYTNRPNYREGRMYYDSDFETLVLYGNSANVAIPMGEREWVRCRNSTLVTIPKGTPVYITGVHIPGHPVHGHHPTVEPADASDNNKKDVLGITGEDITPSNHGYVIVRGYLNGIDTSNLVSGERGHLGFEQPGTIIGYAPSYPNYPVDLGTCLTVDAVNGVFYVDITSHSIEGLRVSGTGYVDGDFTVAGNLTIQGSQTSLQVQGLNVTDNWIYLGSGDSVVTYFTGTGLNDMNFRGHFTGNVDTTFYVKIDSTGATDTFAWSLDNFATLQDSNIPITSGQHALTAGISVEFVAVTGHTLNDVWYGTAQRKNVDFGIISNYHDTEYTHAGIYRDAGDGEFKIFRRYNPEISGNIDNTDPSFALGNLTINRLTSANVTATVGNLGGLTVTGIANVRGTANFIGSGAQEYTLLVKGSSTGSYLGIGTNGTAGIGINADVLNYNSVGYAPYKTTASEIHFNITDSSNSVVTTDALVVTTTGIVSVGSTTESSSTSSGALQVAGGVGIVGNTFIGKNLTVAGNLFVQGTTTYFNANNLVVNDSIVDLHYNDTGTWAGNDGRDIGLRFNFYKTSNDDAFLGWANDTGYLEWYGQGATEGVGGAITGTYGTFKTGNVVVTGNITAPSFRYANGVSILDPIDTALSTLTANAAAQAGTLTTLTANAAVQSGDIATLTANAALQAGQIATLQSDVTTLYANAGAQAGTLATLTANAISQGVDISSLQVDVVSLFNNAAAQHTSILTLISNAAVQAGQIDTLFANAGVQAFNIYNLQNDVANITANVTTIQGNITALYANAASQAGTLATLTANAAAQSGDLATLYANAATQAGELATLTSNAATQAGSLATLTANAASQAGELAVLTANAAVQAGFIANVLSTSFEALSKNIRSYPYVINYNGSLVANVIYSPAGANIITKLFAYDINNQITSIAIYGNDLGNVFTKNLSYTGGSVSSVSYSKL